MGTLWPHTLHALVHGLLPWRPTEELRVRTKAGAARPPGGLTSPPPTPGGWGVTGRVPWGQPQGRHPCLLPPSLLQETACDTGLAVHSGGVRVWWIIAPRMLRLFIVVKHTRHHCTIFITSRGPDQRCRVPPRRGAPSPPPTPERIFFPNRLCRPQNLVPIPSLRPWRPRSALRLCGSDSPHPSCKWNRTVFLLFCLACVTEHGALRVRPHGSRCWNALPSHGRIIIQWSVCSPFGLPTRPSRGADSSSRSCFQFCGGRAPTGTRIIQQVYV